jgi:hypothetical protein
MGWCADTDWDLTFHSTEAWVAFVDEVATHPRIGGVRWIPPRDLPTVDTPHLVGELCAEQSEMTLTNLRLRASTSGKWFEDEVLDVAAKYADGTVDFPNSEDGEPFQLRLAGGQISQVRGQIVYPGDSHPLTEDQARAVVAAIQAGEVDAHDLRCLVADPRGWIAESSTGVATQLRSAQPARGPLMTQPVTTVTTTPAPGARRDPAAGRSRS